MLRLVWGGAEARLEGEDACLNVMGRSLGTLAFEEKNGWRSFAVRDSKNLSRRSGRRYLRATARTLKESRFSSRLITNVLSASSSILLWFRRSRSSRSSWEGGGGEED